MRFLCGDSIHLLKLGKLKLRQLLCCIGFDKNLLRRLCRVHHKISVVR